MGIRLFLQKGRLPPGIVVPGDFTLQKTHPKVRAIVGTIILDMIDAPDVPDGGIEQVVGFGLDDTNGDPVRNTIMLEMTAFLDQYGTEVPTEGVLFSDASAGTILDGDGTPWIKVLTDNDGEFGCKLTCIPRTTIWLACNITAGGPFINCSERDAVTFKPKGVS